MIKIRLMKQIANSRLISSFRYYRAAKRDDQGSPLERAKPLGYAKVLKSNPHSKWRSGVWQVER